ncbi:MAG: Beta-carotene ketolase [uncultured Sphingosinicella sp.]|uniref:Pyridine nucleotide-disulfide oxidoreductase domain-containing protein 2 n=1 Tax=uncultured Sphingosinicella sp. TaxID=478748 RepID=A0A6J4TCJ9_9SPHN|nr:NAD(P)/FAD-dependent oxidoreductase [uncultured Sphingosinicella sp.]CAA9518710.1 MAG: Beta-carotene ketolase [uncultured Sphingosinicella sp.]
MAASDQVSDVLVVGAGHNGLVCAFYLASRGLKVTVLERRHVVGGAAVTEEFHPGFRNSTASYTVSLLNPKIINDMRLYEQGLRVVLRKVDNFLPTIGGDYLLSGSGGLTRREIARHSADDAAAYDAYSKALEAVVRILREWILRAPPNAGGGFADILALLKLGGGLNRLQIEEQRNLLDFFTKSAGDILRRYFGTDIVQALFGFDAVVGNYASPETPGSAYVLLHHLFGEAAGVPGAWGHAIGGMGAITQAMAKACRDKGVEIVLEAPVEAIIVEKGRAAGVVAGGRTWRARQIVANVHPKLLFERLLPAGAVAPEVSARMRGWASESATFRMNVALSELPRFTSLPEAGDHLTAGIIMAPSLGYMDRAYLDARRDGWSREPIVEMLIPSTLDDSLAPPGQHVASLFCQHFPYQVDGGWDARRDKAADHIIAAVDRYAPGFKVSVVGRSALSPLDLERRFGLVGGDIFHGKMGLDQLFSARPMLGHADYRMPLPGLYLCGSGAHPGGGVTGAPGHNAARAIFADRRTFRRIR